MGWEEPTTSGRWRGVTRAGGPKRSKVFDLRHEARQWWQDEEAGRDHDALPLAELTAPTVGRYALAWVNRHAATLGKATELEYRRAVNVLRHDSLGAVELRELKREHVQRWLARQLNAGTSLHVARQRMKVLRLVVRDAYLNREPGMDRDVTQGVRIPSPPKRAARIILPEEDKLVTEAAATPEELAWLLLGLDAGLRWGEAAAIHVDAVRGDVIHVLRVYDRHLGQLRPYAKNRSAADTVPIMTERLAGVLAELTPDPRTGLLLANGAGNPHHYPSWRMRLWVPLMDRATLDPRPSYHALRHTLATRLLDAGMPRGQVAKVLRHSDEGTTSGYHNVGAVRAVGEEGTQALARLGVNVT